MYRILEHIGEEVDVKAYLGGECISDTFSGKIYSNNIKVILYVPEQQSCKQYNDRVDKLVVFKQGTEEVIGECKLKITSSVNLRNGFKYSLYIN